MKLPEKTTTTQSRDEQKPSAPSIALPKGGGAIRGIGEKFAANPVTGTGSMSVPIATSPGRSGFGPELSLSYDSGVGNGPFGFGWSLSLPSITRKTDKGLPQYRDAEDSDVFILSGTEDLVPVYRQDHEGTWVAGQPGHERDVDGFWVRDPSGRLVIHEDVLDEYRVRRYRPRIEGLFARIERWTRLNDPSDVHWRSISKDNILTLYGLDANSRIADPLDARHIFTWLICETRDDKGNAVLYRYKAEDGTGVDPGQVHERNRGPRDDVRRTANRYLKRIHYGNRTPLLDSAGRRPHFLDPAQVNAQIASSEWMFEAVFDYDDHDPDSPAPRDDEVTDAAGALRYPWTRRQDPFSNYRAGFEVRTTRLCQRVLMFHHFPGTELDGVGADCLVRSTDFTYSNEVDPTNVRNPVYTFLRSVTQTGYRRRNGGYDRRSLPPVEFEYSEPVVQDTVEQVDRGNLENLPVGLDGSNYRWTDLHGEGIPGILTEQAGTWYYKRNLSPIPERLDDGSQRVAAKFAALETVALKPNLALAGSAEFMDLAGDGLPDLVVLDGPTPGLYEHDGDEGWQPFRPFTSHPNRDFRDPNLKFVDLDGDGHADVLITEDDAFLWHPSLAEAGFGPARRVTQPFDEEKGPRVVFADSSQSIHLADLGGDGLTDIVRIRNGEVCYWPNLGYGHFGAKITMDHAPWFDHPDQFDPQRIRLADIDGSGAIDILYLHRDGVRLYFNQSGNSWSEPQILNVFPRVDDLVSITPIDLLGNGTACLVWSSPLPGDASRPMRYVNLMGKHKPHLLIRTVNNLGAETRVHYAPSTKFYLQDKRDGKPWITRLPFPVHVVERVETYDHISRNRFVTRYAYHHGYFDGEEREFRGFGMVEQWDTEEFTALGTNGALQDASNTDAASHVPPVHTKTWFHTGVYLDRDHVSRQFELEYYREPGLSDDGFRAQLLPDTTLPSALTLEEEREACRALKGMMLRQEIYADDAEPEDPPDRIQRARTPYTVTEQDFTIRPLQPRAGNRHAVFFTHPREAITDHYERNPADPRIQHALTLEVDDFGNVLKEAAIGYGRRAPDPTLAADDRAKQAVILITYTENQVTNAIEADDDYRTPLPSESRTYELTGLTLPAGQRRFTLAEMLTAGTDAESIDYEQSPTAGVLQKRLIEQVRTRYRPDDLGAAGNDPSALLPLGTLEPLALPGESYQLAFTPGLLEQIYVRNGQRLLPADPADVLEGGGPKRGGYVELDGDGRWWIPSGRAFFTINPADDSAIELAQARQHFFLPRRSRDPFGQDAFVDFDTYDLLMVETRDALDNRVTVGERDAAGNLTAPGNDYRVLQPRLVTDPNRNRTEVAFDTLGMVAGTAVKGKDDTEGDRLAGLEADLTPAQIDAFYGAGDPHAFAADLLKGATTRIVYDLDRFRNTGQPVFSATLARETHVSDPLPPDGLKIQISFSYSDGFGREIQKKIQAEPGPLVEGGPMVSPRWVGSGWTIFNNKGKPVRQYEPFFTDTHRFEFDVRIGVSPVLFYDAAERVVATLHPNHIWEKIVFDPWQQTSYDGNDTVLFDPQTDDDVKAFFARLPDAEYLPTWHGQRSGEPLGSPEQDAAMKAAVHADTPAVAHFDSLGRPFLTVAHNKFERNGAIIEGHYFTRVELDIEGNERAVIDAKDRIVMRYDYDMLSKRIHQASMEAGERWMLNDVAGKPIRAWDSRRHGFFTDYDALRRPTSTFLHEEGEPVRLIGHMVYGETEPQPTTNNLRGQAVRVFDQAGVVTTDAYDFKGNLLRSARTVAGDYKKIYDWSSNAVDPSWESFHSKTTYDALGRPISVTAPDGSVHRPTFNEANLLEKISVNLRGAAEATPFVTNIDYDAKGQRVFIEYGNGARTHYEYDPLTFRLLRLLTRRNAAAFPGDDPQPPIASWPGRYVQNLNYTYDPPGNITRIRDDAQQTIFFNNQRIEPSNAYTYDALYRLIQATGREHLGQNGEPVAHSHDDALRSRRPHSNDGSAMARYCEKYVYDTVGNFLEMSHHRSCPDNPSWTRSYAYDEASLIEPGKNSNRLSRTQVGNGISAQPESYSYDSHGNMLHMPHLTAMDWDFADQLRRVELGGGGTAFYVYDATGQRVRKVVERLNGTRQEERLYLGGFEIYRKYEGDGETVRLERETLHVMDDQQRIGLVETKTVDEASSVANPEPLMRYQFGNHLGSASLELDGEGEIISYEEYMPYGSTAYQAVRGGVEVSRKRYRYTGMERDEETGLSYHTRRYYPLWLARWVSSDPIGISDGLNTYSYSQNRPTALSDPEGTDSRGRLGGVGTCSENDITSPFTISPLTPNKVEQRIAAQESNENQPRTRIDKYGRQVGDWSNRQGRAAFRKKLNRHRDPSRVTVTAKVGAMILVPIHYFLTSSIWHSAHGEPKEAAVDLGLALFSRLLSRTGRTEAPTARGGKRADSISPSAPAPPLGEMEIRYTGKMATSPSDANFLRLNVEWAQQERGFLTLGVRNPADARFRAWARRRMDSSGFSRTGRQAMHPLDSSINPWVQSGTPGRTYYFGSSEVNLSFGGQIGSEIKRLNLRLGDNFTIRFRGFPSYSTARPIAPPSSPPNLSQ